MLRSPPVLTLVLLLLLSPSSVLRMCLAQVPIPMGVCYPAGADEVEVQGFCQMAPDCGEMDGVDPTTMECYMRCEDLVDPDEVMFNCEDYGMVCHMGMACVLPPVLDEDIEGPATEAEQAESPLEDGS